MGRSRAVDIAVVLGSVAGLWLVAVGGPIWLLLQVGIVAVPPLVDAVPRTLRRPLPERLRTSDVAGHLNRYPRMPLVVWLPMLLETALVWPATRVLGDFWYDAAILAEATDGGRNPAVGAFVVIQVVAILCLGLGLLAGMLLAMVVVFPTLALVRVLREPELRDRRKDVATLLLFPVVAGMLTFLFVSVAAGMGGVYAGKGSGLASLLYMGIALVAPGFPTVVPWALWTARLLALVVVALLAVRWRARRSLT